jgi:hypothetical protein
MTLSEHYKKAVLYPSLFVFIVATVFSIIENYNYKSEWLTADTVIFLSIGTAFIYCLIFCLLSLTIFLNRLEKIKENGVLSFLSWFLFPFGFMIVVFAHEISFKIRYDEKFDSDFVFVIVLNLPFLFGLIWSYVIYKRADRLIQ